MLPNPSPLVFLDSNVIVSGLYSATGPPGAILREFGQGHLQVVISPLVLEEVIGVLENKLPAALPVLRTLLLSSPPIIAREPVPEEISRWAALIHAEDAPILTAAINARADYLVSGDRHFQRIRRSADLGGLRIVTPPEFMRELRKKTGN